MVWWAIKCWLPYAQFGLWSLRNPGLSFKQFYAECAANSLAINKSHSSLGPNLRPGRLASARRTFERLLTYGIRPGDTVVDYGCGTLRLGALFIEFLEADGYIGLDIDRRIIAAGREQLADDIVETKRPTLEVISKESLARVAARNPRWVCSKGVLQHVPPEELNDYFASLSPLIHAGATSLLFSHIAPESKRMSLKTWAHDFDQLHATAKDHGMRLGKLKWRGRFMELRAASGA
jgi:cyclopropane fatty-acyl-phospholipid synthase-like methyltransferase